MAESKIGICILNLIALPALPTMTKIGICAAVTDICLLSFRTLKHVIFDIDVIGALNIKKKYPNQTLSIFIIPPSINVLEERLRSRGTDSETALLERIQKATRKLNFQKSLINRLSMMIWKNQKNKWKMNI